MNGISKFIVLIERRRLGRRLMAALTALSMIATGFAPVSVHAAAKGHDKGLKLARDLDDEAANVGAPKAKWSRDVNGVRQVQAVVVSNSTDPALTSLRAWVLGTGGSVHALHSGINALTVQLPANRVRQLAQRSDVVSVSPNRSTQRTASTLESITGALASNVRTSSTKTSYLGFDGTGVGIAVLDSGVMKTHEGLMTSGAVSRVKKNVSMLSTSQENWTTGVDNTVTSLQPGSTALANYESSINTAGATTQDAYGHGTHVASVAAGRAALYSSGTPDTTGIAPGADIYDVKVLDGYGFGTLSDAIEGIGLDMIGKAGHHAEVFAEAVVM